jgi:hypothetical protein
MAEERLESHDPAVPAAAEAIHLPGPSYLPVFLAFGVTIALVGVITTFVLSAIGLVIALVAFFKWLGEARAEMAELPLEHH